MIEPLVIEGEVTPILFIPTEGTFVDKDEWWRVSIGLAIDSLVAQVTQRVGGRVKITMKDKDG